MKKKNKERKKKTWHTSPKRSVFFPLCSSLFFFIGRRYPRSTNSPQNEKKPWADLTFAKTFGIVTGDVLVSYWSIFSLSSVTVPEVFAKVNSAPVSFSFVIHFREKKKFRHDGQFLSVLSFLFPIFPPFCQVHAFTKFAYLHFRGSLIHRFYQDILHTSFQCSHILRWLAVWTSSQTIFGPHSERVGSKWVQFTDK